MIEGIYFDYMKVVPFGAEIAVDDILSGRASIPELMLLKPFDFIF